ncbi:hypothetical protein PSCT_03070 [Pseudomonas sp. SCT]|nr:hypothetical protein PSCT_03070 [Pseudomonas sp. SCT]
MSCPLAANSGQLINQNEMTAASIASSNFVQLPFNASNSLSPAIGLNLRRDNIYTQI